MVKMNTCIFDKIGYCFNVDFLKKSFKEHSGIFLVMSQMFFCSTCCCLVKHKHTIVVVHQACFQSALESVLQNVLKMKYIQKQRFCGMDCLLVSPEPVVCQMWKDPDISGCMYSAVLLQLIRSYDTGEIICIVNYFIILESVS